MEPVRILHVLGKLNRGGAETLVMNWYRNIDRTKFQFDFVLHTTEDCSYSDEVIALGGKIFSVPEYRGKNHFQYCQAWREFFEQHKEYKIIHGHVRSTAAIYLSIAKKYNRVTISHSHAINAGSGIEGMIKTILQYPIRYIADYQWACSEAAGKFLFGKTGVKKNKFSIVKNAIDVKKFEYNNCVRQEVRSELSLSDKIVVGHVGRFTFEKNHTFLIDVFEKFHRENDDSVLLLVGIGPLFDEVRENVKNKNLQNSVLFLGERADIDRIMQGIDLFLFPSLYEGLGIVALEAQAADLPVIISDRIPMDVKILEDTQVCSVDRANSYELWCEIMKKTDYTLRKRKSRTELLINAGYDIEVETSKLLKKYEKMIKDKE